LKNSIKLISQTVLQFWWCCRMVGASVVHGKMLETIQRFQLKWVCVVNWSIINHGLMKKVHSLDQRKQA